ncbi:hypothetical protein OLMES_2406 [Oleiphilus messinensis]|uniref:Uncharacterized protein n=1 Tax=Oleiphilus messinensis TaxID=141451 RepID=A0A1Y0I7I4_9GAMM|nr:hypothetical protein [Oleiphilus messinensis]ARU56467.1 hypothetical protein OLMES_2406 [Oleiphilus messinensis]
MKTCSILNWGESWELEYEVPLLSALASDIESVHTDLKCELDKASKECIFCEVIRADKIIAKICVDEHESGQPLYSVYLGSKEDEFHGFNKMTIISILSNYTDALPVKL